MCIIEAEKVKNIQPLQSKILENPAQNFNFGVDKMSRKL